MIIIQESEKMDLEDEIKMERKQAVPAKCFKN